MSTTFDEFDEFDENNIDAQVAAFAVDDGQYRECPRRLAGEQAVLGQPGGFGQTPRGQRRFCFRDLWVGRCRARCRCQATV